VAKRTGNKKTTDPLAARLAAFAAERFPTAVAGIVTALEPLFESRSGENEAAIDALREPARIAILERFGSAAPLEALETSPTVSANERLAAETRRIAARLLRALEESKQVAVRRLSYALMPDDGVSLSNLLDRAEERLSA